MPEREWAVRLYSETRLPVEDIAGLFGVSRQTIYNWIEEAGVPRRGPAGSMPRPSGEEAGSSLGDRIETHLIAQDARAEFWSAEIARLRDDVAALRSDVLSNRDSLTAAATTWAAQLAELNSQIARLGGLIEGRRPNGGEGDVRFLKGK